MRSIGRGDVPSQVCPLGVLSVLQYLECGVFSAPSASTFRELVVVFCGL